MSIKELLAVLSDEVGDSLEPMNAALERMRTTPPVEDAYHEAFELYSEQVLRIGEVAEMLELAAMGELCERVAENLAALPEQPADSPLFDLLRAWPELLRTYLQHPHRGGSAEGLAGHFANRWWPFPLEEAQVADLTGRLRADIGHADAVQAAQARGHARPTEVQAGDVELRFAPDLTQELLDSFLVEGPGHTAHFLEVIQRVLADRGDISSLDEARRVIHTLKGAANTLGVRGIANLCHHTEDILQYLVQQGLQPPRELGQLLLRVADHLEAMVGSLLGEEEAPTDSIGLLQQVLAWAQRIDHGEMDAPTAGMPDLQGQATPITLEPAVPSAIAPQPEPIRGAPQAAANLHVPTSTLDGLVRLAGEITISQRQMQGQLATMEGRLRELREQYRLLRQRTLELEEVVDIQGVGAGVERGRPTTNPEGRAFDSLELDRYNELHSHTHAFIEAFADVQVVVDQFAGQIAGLKGRLEEQGRTNADLHQGLLDARMVPAAQISARLQRALRNACHLTGKQARLEISGEEVMLDSYVLTAIAEPLIHLLRNAVDHGIEDVEERLRLGKPAEGVIHLAFGHEGNKIVVHCSDDGAGLDLERIRQQAFTRGLLQEGQAVSDSELMHLVLTPGFSTARQVTQVSGRGIGMDVVNATLSQLKGAIDIQSRRAGGTNFTLRLPVTLTSIDALLVGVGEDVVAVLVDEVEHVVHAGARDIEYIGDQWVFHRAETAYPVLSLAEVLGYPSDHALGETDDRRPLLLIRFAPDEITAVVVDRLVDTQELVMKAPGKYLARLPGVIGISVLGDGRVTPVVDLIYLLHRHQSGGTSVHAHHDLNLMAAPVSGEAEVLIVDDSLSVRQSLSQLLTDAGFRTRTARDGFEAIAAIHENPPAAMLVDLEMPRMNGLELTEHVRAQEALEGMPIIMITSRSQEKHRERARQAGVDAYFTKPYQDIELLGTLLGRMGTRH